MQCTSNLRQIGQALMIYVNQSKGMIPVAPKNACNDFDAWYYRTSPNPPDRQLRVFDNLSNSPIGRILKSLAEELQGPALPHRPARAAAQAAAYIYSYVFNRFFNGNSTNPRADQEDHASAR